MRRARRWLATGGTARPLSGRHDERQLAEAKNELRVVGHLLWRPRRVPRQLDLDVLDLGHRARDLIDVLLNHRPDRAAHRGQRMDHLDLGALDLDVVEQAELDDVHPELGVLDGAQGVDDLFLRSHQVQPSAPSSNAARFDGALTEQPYLLAALTGED